MIIDSSDLSRIQSGHRFKHTNHGGEATVFTVAEVFAVGNCSGTLTNGGQCGTHVGVRRRDTPHLHTKCGLWTDLSDQPLRSIDWLDLELTVTTKLEPSLKLGDVVRFNGSDSNEEETIIEVFDGVCNKRILINGHPCRVTTPHAHFRNSRTNELTWSVLTDCMGTSTILRNDAFLGLRVGDQYRYKDNDIATILHLCPACMRSSTPHVHTLTGGWDYVGTAIRLLLADEGIVTHEKLIEKYGERATKVNFVQPDVSTKASEPWPYQLKKQIQFFLRNPPRHMVSPNGHIDERLPIVLARLADPVENFTRANSYEEFEKVAMQHMELLGGTPRNTFTKRVLRVR